METRIADVCGHDIHYMHSYSPYLTQVYYDPRNSVYYMQGGDLSDVLKKEFSAEYVVLREDTGSYSLYNDLLSRCTQKELIYSVNGVFLYRLT